MSESSHQVVMDDYEVLGVGVDATPQEIKKAFRQIARECHPDVAGDDPTAAERFKRALLAYENLVDPVKRARYDRRRSSTGRNPYFDFWMGREPEPEARPRSKRGDPANNIGLEDIFNDFGGWADFGFGQGSAPSSETAPPRERQPPMPGRDIKRQVPVPASVALQGGTVTVRYQRLCRPETGDSLQQIDEIYDLRVPPGTQHGDTLRAPRMGDAGFGGGPYGDLVCDIQVVATASTSTAGGAHTRSSPKQRQPTPSPLFQAADGSPERPLPLPISVTEALLGGRVEVDTPQGRVRLVVPPCTSSGRVFRLRRKGEGAGDEGPADLFLCAQVMAPASLDEESRTLAEEFARLNPYDPRL